LAGRYAGLIDAAVGIHPHHAAEIDEAGWARLESLAGESGVVLIGEIGLDMFRKLSPPDRQREAFRRQLALAAQLRKPVVVHDRDAHDEIREQLLGWQGPPATGDLPTTGGPPRFRGMLHAYSGDQGMAATLASAGFAISFALPVTFRSAYGPRAAVTALPAGNILVETDSPFLGPDRERRNEPQTALRVVAGVARLRGEAPVRLAASVADAYRRLVGG
jgi:TatD DNase family protein